MKQASVNTQTILQRITDAVIALDKDWSVTYLNTKAEIFFSKPCHYLPGKNIWLEFPKLAGSEFYKACISAMEKQQMISIEIYHEEKNAWLQKNIYPSADGITILFNDITAKKQAEVRGLNARIESEKKLHDEKDLSDKIINSLPGIFYMSDRTPKLLLWNKAFETISSYAAEELGTMVPINLFEPEDHPHFMASMEKAYSEGFADTEARLISKDGKVTPFYFTGVRIDYMGKPAMLGVGIDITERIQGELTIKESEEKYRNLFERASESIVVHNIQGSILDVNSTAAFFSGYSKEELKSLNIADLLFPEDLERTPVPIERLIAGETTLTRRRIKTRMGVIRIMDVSSKMLPDGNVMAIVRDVTEKSEAEKALSISELRFRTLAGNAPTGIFETNGKGETIYANGKMIEYTGLSFDELLGTNWIKSIHPDDRNEVLKNWEQNVDRKKESSSEYRLVHKNGEVRWVSGKAVPVYDRNGHFSGYLGTVSDITKEKLALLALKESEEKYRALVEQASDGIYIADADGRIITVNSSSCRLSGYTEEEILGKSIAEFVPEDELKKNPLRFDELKQGRTVTSERKIKLKSGETLQVESITKMLSDGRILSFVRDITERTKARNEIIKEKNLSDTIINSLPGIFYLYDEEGNFRRWNKNLEFISGYIDTEIIKMKPLDFFDIDERNLLKQKGDEVFGRGMADVEAHFFTKDKRKIPYYFNGWRVMFEGKPCLIGLGIDITEKRKSEELLIKSHEDVRQLASHLTWVREEERKRIGREIHDELGQQLTAIKMDVAWIDKKTHDETGPVKNKLKNIISLLDGSNESVRRILTELSPGIIDNHGLLEGLERLNRQFTNATGIHVEFTTNKSIIDLAQEIANCIFRVYQESLTNIMRYAHADKVVTSLNIKTDVVVVTIKDDGKGFDATAIQTKKSFGILGMKERVLSQNGKFELQSKMGRGTKIMVTVPYRSE